MAGEIGLDNSINSAFGQEIDAMISKGNLEAALKSGDASLKNLVDSVIIMIRDWPIESKVKLLKEYGNVNDINKNMSTTQLNKTLAATIISHLPVSELRKFIKKIESRNAQLSRDIQTIESQRSRYAAQQTRGLTAALSSQAEESIKNSEALLKNINISINNAAAAAKNSKFKAADFAIDTYSKDAISGLRKELKEVLKNYTDGRLAFLIGKINIEYVEGNTSKKTLLDRLTNIISCYAAFILGSVKGIHGSVFSPDAIIEFDNILLQTSFGWITGKVGVNDRLFIEKRKQAKDAKKNLLIGQKITAARNKAEENTRRTLTGKTKSSLKTRIGKTGQTYNKTKEDLNNLSDDQIRAIAAKLNISNYETESIENLKERIAIISSYEKQTLLKQYKSDIKNAKTDSDRLAAEESLKTGMANSTFAAMRENTKTQDFSDKIPVISFTDKGELLSETIRSAVPVWVMNPNGDSISLGDTGVNRKLVEKNAKARNINGFLTDDDVKKYSLNKKRYVGITGPGLFGNRKVLARFNESTASFIDKLKNNLLDESDSTDVTTATEKPISSSKTGASGKLRKVMSASMKTLIKRAHLQDTNGNILPVMDVNLSNDYIRGYLPHISSQISNVENKLSDIAGFTAAFPAMFATLQEAGLSINAAAAGGTAGAVLQTATETADIAFRKISDGYAAFSKAPVNDNILPKFAKGGTYAGPSSIITGDAGINGKANPELVTVDWNSKKINVTPTSTGQQSTFSGTQNSQSGSTTSKLPVGERHVPLNVSVSSGLVKYNKQLSDVSDDNIKTAVKVYSVNNGIYDKVKIGDGEYSLFDVVYGLVGSVNSIANSIAEGNGLLSIIAKNTTNLKTNTLNNASGFVFPENLNSVLAGV